MKRSKQWLTEANKLCSKLDSEDGIDPRILARNYESKTRFHKAEQLSKEAGRILSIILSGELSDPIYQDLQVIDVSRNNDGQFLVVKVTHLDAYSELVRILALTKLNAIKGYLRSVIAQSVKRKRVPALKFQVVAVTDEVNDHAY
ncbi:MAG: ribosome-binding factor A [Candidatus Thiodiazotropha sp. DIVDIV]